MSDEPEPVPAREPFRYPETDAIQKALLWTEIRTYEHVLELVAAAGLREGDPLVRAIRGMKESTEKDLINLTES